MKITIINKTKRIVTPNEPIKPSDLYPNGLRPPGARQPLAEYSYLRWFVAGINGYSR